MEFTNTGILKMPEHKKRNPKLDRAIEETKREIRKIGTQSASVRLKLKVS